MKSCLPILAVALVAGTGAGWAQTGAITPEDPHAAHHAVDATKANTDGGYAEGEVRRIDKGAGKITLKHGPIASLDMPAMSMVFRAKDAALLDQVKEGDKVRFKAEKIQGALTVTKIEPAR